MSRLTRLLVVLLLALMPTLIWAQTAKSEYSVLIDADHDPATGCSVTLPSAGKVEGIERRLIATLGSPLQGVSLTLERCVNGGFDNATALSGAPVPVGLNTGLAGADVIELAVPSGTVALGGVMRLYFAARGPSSDDLLATVDGSPNGKAIFFTSSPVPIPTLAHWTLLLAGILLAIIAALHYRRHTAQLFSGVVLLMALGAALAAGFVLDGQVNDWQGVPPVATDPTGDSAPATDITAGFAAEEGGALFFRMDVGDMEAPSSANRPPVFSSAPVTVAGVGSPYSYAIATSDPDGNALTLTAPTKPAWLTFTPGGNGAGTLSGAPTVADVGSHAVVLRVTDNGNPALSATQSFTIVVSANPPGNQAPVIDLNGPAAGLDFATSFTAGGGPIPAVDAANLTVTDPDSPNVASATVTLTQVLDAGQEILAVAPTTVAPNSPISAAYNSATGVLSLTGGATLAQYQAALRSVTYHNTAVAPNTTARTLTFVVNDGITNSALASSIVSIVVRNHAPSFAKGPDQSVNEDAGAQAVNPWATAISDGDGNTQTLTFTVTGNTNPALFSAGPSISATGVLSYTPAANANGAATLAVVLRDSGGTADGGVDTSAPQTFTITVNAVNDAPSFVKGPDQAVSGTAGPQSVPWATAISAGPSNEAGQTMTFAITGNTNPALFSVGPAISPTGVLSYTPANVTGGTTLTVILQDNGGTANGGVDTSAPQTFVITVNSVNIPPTAVNDAATVTEDAAATPIDVLANDTDPDGGPKTIAAVTQPAQGAVLITGGGAGLTYQPNANYCNTPPGTTLETFAYTLAPGGSSATVTVTVTCANDAPVLDLDGAADNPGGDINTTATFIKGAGPVVIVDAANLTVTDADNASLVSATVTLINILDAGQETLAATTAGTAITATYNSATGVLTLTGPDTLAAFQQVLRTVTYNNAALNPNTTARAVQFTASDGVDASAVAVSTVTVLNVNSAPSFTVGPNQTVNQNAGAQTVNPWATAISDGDGGTQTLTFAVTGNTNPGLFSAGPAVSSTGALTYTPAANASGTVTITVTLSDDGGTANGGVDTSAPQTFTITVNPVNDAPSFTAGPNQTVNEDSGSQTVVGWAAAISPGPADEAGQALTFQVTGNTNAGLFSAAPAVAANGTLTYTPAANANGAATLTVVLKDDGGTANGGTDTSAPQTFTITVNAVNDAPSFIGGPNQAVNEDPGPQTVNPWATAISAGPPNEAGQTLAFAITGNTNPALFSAGPTISATGVLGYTPAANANGAATLTVVLKDSGGTANGGADTSAPQTFTITVNPVNDPPVAQAKTAEAQANMRIVGLSGLLAGVTDADTGVNGCAPTFTVASLTSGAGGTVSNLNAATGTFDFEPNPGFTGTATASYTVQDTGCLGTATSAPATISITVNGPVIWFVNQAAAAGGNGTLARPFQTVAAADGVDAANQRIFVASGAYLNGIALNSDEWLIGQGVSGASFDAVFGIAPPVGTLARPAIGGARPTLQNTVTLGTNSQVKGLNIASATTTGITASGKTGLVTGEVSVTTTTGTAVNLANSGGAVSFTSVSANGAASGIVLNNTTGSFTVTGTGATGSGGTIQNSSGPGISLTSTANVSLSRMNIQSGGDDGIRGSSVTGLSLNGVQVTSNGNAAGEAGVDLTNLIGTGTWTGITVNGSAEDNVVIRNSSGTLTNLTVTGSTFSNNSSIGNDGFLMEGLGTASMKASVTGSTFTANRGDHFQAAAGNSAVLDVVFSGNTLTGGHPTALGQGITINAATGVASGGYTGRVDYDINGNNVNGAITNAIHVILGTSGAGAVFDGFIRNNVIGTSGAALSCSSQANGIGVEARGNGTHNSAVTGNTIRQCFDRGILSEAGDGDSVLNLTVQSNTIDQQVDAGAREAIQTNYGITSTNVFGNVDTNNVCLQLGGAGALANVFSHGGGAPDDFRLRKRQEATVRLPGYVGGTDQTAGSLAQVVAFIQGQNTGSAGEPGSAAASGAGGGYTGGAACTLPSP